MPQPMTVQHLISLVEQGREVEALRMYYAPHAKTYENTDLPTIGLEALIAKEQRFLDSLKAMHIRKADSYIVDAERVAINWHFEFITGQGTLVYMNEIAYQLWENEQVVEERYYYDTASLRVSGNT